MSKERLEESKNVIEDIEDLQNERDFRQADIAKCYLVEKHGRWLIEQAERVQELESELEVYENTLIDSDNRWSKLKIEVERANKKADHFKKEHSELVGVGGMWLNVSNKLEKTEQQNKRYREALESISNGPGEVGCLEIYAREALEGDPHESS